MKKLFVNSTVVFLVLSFTLPIYGDIQFLKYNLVDILPDFHISPNSEKIGCTWINGHVWDKPLIKKFYSLLPKNDFFVAIDIGAQTGCFSLISKYFPNSIWYAFEPIQEAATTLRENLRLNSIKNVFVYQMCVTNFCGKSKLKLPEMHRWGLATLGTKRLRFVPVAEREVDCINLDSFVDNQNIKKIHFIKIDTEGSELSILQGAKKVILRDHPVILMEYNESNMRACGVLKEEINEFLKESGYQWKLISKEDILCIPL